MAFIDDHPYYNAYEHDTYKVDRLPYYFHNDLKGFIHSQLSKLDDDEILGTALQLQHQLAALAGIEPAYPGPYEHLNDEIIRAFRRLAEFPNSMDGLGIILSVFGDEESFESFLEKQEIGYLASLWRGQVTWNIREDVEKPYEKIEEVIPLIPNQYKDTISNLQQAIRMFANADDDKSRKSALRDCISAVEGYLKSVTGTKDFAQADATINNMNLSDPIITRDALRIWRHIHNNLLDVRHGNNENISRLGIEEVTYYIERLMAYIKYINSKIR
ncbi:hypothetical protein [Mesobacillus jeotgali]|uniref:hypothetical protein n=1 Tax=Mesobacillus jeotgali TaxID=129985 RepID=UPI001780C2B6|nr:hypothetical protein [Mesobacillus jeotgali]UYZ22535.1 hypothetical protein FOF60_02795 [Mesobacillus jeotgali]